MVTVDAHELGGTRRGAHVLFGLGLLCAGLIAWRFALVDDGALLDVVHGMRGRALREGAWFGLAAALSGLVVGNAYGRRLRAGSGWLLVGATAALVAAALWWPRVAASFAMIHDQADGVRAAIVLGWAVAAAAGAHGGLTLSRCERQGRFYNATTGLVVLALAVASGAWLELFGLLWLGVVAAALGRWSLARLRAPVDAAPGLALATGMAVAIPLVLVLGITLGCSAPWLLGLVVVLTAALFRQVGAVLRATPDILYPDDERLSAAGAIGHGALLALFGFYGLAALAPEVGPDAIGMRIAAPQHWLRSGELTGLPEMVGTYGYIAGEMLFLLGLPLLGTVAAKLIQAAVLLAIVLGLRRHLESGDRAGSGAAAPWLFLLASGSILWVQVAWGFVDVLQAWFIYATVAGLQAWSLDRQRWGVLAAASLCAGTAAAIKMNGGIATVIAGVVVVGLLGFGARRWRALSIGVVLVGAGCVAALLPWLIRSVVLTNNPVFPVANGVFASPLASTELIAHPFPGDVLWRVPWSLFFTPRLFVEIGSYHPALLALLPLALAGLWIGRVRVGVFGAAAVVASAFWALTELNARYSLFAAVLVTAVLARGMMAWQNRLGWRGRAGLDVVVVLLAVLGFGAQLCRPGAWLWHGNGGPALPTRVVFGTTDVDEYLRGQRRTWPAARWLNEHHGGAARLWQVPAIRDHLYFEAPAIAMPHGVPAVVDPLVPILTDAAVQGAPERIWRILRDAGITHVLYSTDDARVRDVPDSARTGLFAPGFAARYLALRQAHSGMRLYAVLPQPRAVALAAAPGLVVNPGFEPDDPAWSAVRGVPVFSDQGVLLTDAAVAQAVRVRGGEIYDLTVTMRRLPAGSGAYVQVNWLDAAGRLLLFWRRPLAGVSVDGTFSFPQTAPEGAATAFLYLSGGGLRCEQVQLKGVTADGQ